MLDLKPGDFFKTKNPINGEYLLYQKIDETKSKNYNAVLLNSGELCYLYFNNLLNDAIEKVEVSFDTKPIE